LSHYVDFRLYDLYCDIKYLLYNMAVINLKKKYCFDVQKNVSGDTIFDVDGYFFF